MSMPTPLDDRNNEPPALATALDLLSQGLWPVPIFSNASGVKSPGKQPIGDDWGAKRPTPALLRATWAAYPDASVGIKLGPESGVVDIENDSGPDGEATLLDMMGGMEFKSKGWGANRGGHTLARFDTRLIKYGRTIIKVGGLEIRIGTINLAEPKQMQSVCPPSPKADGTPREWNGIDDIATLPETFFAYLDATFPPEAKAAPKATIPIYTPKPGSGQWSPEDRAIAYLSRVDPAVSGQGGSSPTFRAACAVGPGFDLSEDQTIRILRENYSPRCEPPWTEKEIVHKVRDAYAKESRRGWLLGDQNSPTNAKLPFSQKREVDCSPEEGFGLFDSFDRVFTEIKNDWEEPRFDPRVEVPAFPLDVFPWQLGELCRSGAKAAGCPEDFYAVFALAIAGAAVGGTTVLKVKPEWYESTCLYSALVAPTGSKKSSPLRTLSKALRKADERYRADYKIAKENWEQLAQECKASKAPTPAPPNLRQLTLDDATREAVAQVHHNNTRGVAIIRDELSAWVCGLNAYRQGKGDDKQFFMSANSGSAVQSDRKGRPNDPIYIARPAITITGPITPCSLPLMKDGQADDGWFDRILFSYPDEIPARGWSDEAIDSQCLADWTEAIEVLLRREMVREEDGSERPFIVNFNAGAKRLFVEWVNLHAAEQRDPEFPSVLRGPWSKIEGFCARFALILSSLHQSYDPTSSNRPVDVNELDVLGARKLAEYYKAHHRRVRSEMYGRTGLMPDTARAMIRWIARRVRIGGKDEHDGYDKAKFFTGRNLSHRFRSIWIDEDRIEAVNWLTKRGVIRDISAPPKPNQVGRPRSSVYAINPLFDGSQFDHQDRNPPQNVPMREPGDEG